MADYDKGDSIVQPKKREERIQTAIDPNCKLHRLTQNDPRWRLWISPTRMAFDVANALDCPARLEEHLQTTRRLNTENKLLELDPTKIQQKTSTPRLRVYGLNFNNMKKNFEDPGEKQQDQQRDVRTDTVQDLQSRYHRWAVCQT